MTMIANVAVALVPRDAVERLAHGIPSALEHLDQRAAREARHARDARLRIAHARHFQELYRIAARRRSGGGAGVDRLHQRHRRERQGTAAAVK